MSPQVPIVFITGWGNQLSSSQLKECGVDYVLTKPFKIEEISSIIKRQLILKKCLKLTRKEVKRTLLYNWLYSINSLEIFKYISFRSCLAAFTAFLISIFLVTGLLRDCGF